VISVWLRFIALLTSARKDLFDLFDPVLEQIIGLVSQQVAAATIKNHSIDVCSSRFILA
jgi:hypothetical protein